MMHPDFIEHWLDRVKREGCGALPRQAERELMVASRVGGAGTATRARAINRAYTRTSDMFPHLFKF